MSILVCAASPTEHSACVRGIRDAGLESEFEVLRTGMGLENAGRSLQQYLKTAARPRLIVSSGFAGAFSPQLARNAWVTAENVLLSGTAVTERSFRARPFNGPGVISCTMVSSAELVSGQDKKLQRYLALPQPVAVDMESAVLAEIAGESGIAIMIFRMITDTPENPLPDFLGPLTGAFTTQGLRARATLGIKGISAAARDARGVVRLVKEGAAWPKMLRRGWSQNAALIHKINLNETVRKS